MSKSIIEKLGITPLHSFPVTTIMGNEIIVSLSDTVKEKENVFNEMLEALIETCLHWEENRYFPNCFYQNNIEAIEKACHPKKWTEIKATL